MSLKNECVVFTGTLSSMTRKQAQAIITSLNGKNQSSITQESTLLIIGSRQSDLLNECQQSKKLTEAIRLNKLGQGIRFMNEKEFIELITQQFQLLLKNL
ncbi:hypothetical protein MPC59_003031 [Listeria monocytogenes]|nr:hypothetical protein [Listeria monocytogenes]EIZ6653600.1 hypothetical protein [Listeria monocytogenes]HDT8000318.1 hypothetical protein [Enterococcus faecalis]HDT8188122.1 hypothetical protein [Enterococcus faecalis]